MDEAMKGERRASKHTQRAYRQEVMDFVQFLELDWPEESTRPFTVSVAEVLAFRDWMLAESKTPKTINRRIRVQPRLLPKYALGRDPDIPQSSDSYS